MKRTLMLMIALCFMVTATGLSTVTRVKTMGRVNHFVLDEANVFLYPSMIVKYSDRFIFDAGEDGNLPLAQQAGVRGFNGVGGGVFYGLDENNHLGFYVNANDAANGNGIAVGVPGGYTFPVTLDDFIGIFYGHDAGNLDFGVELDLASAKTEVTDPAAQKANDKVSRMGIRAGITYDMTNGDMFNFAFTFAKTSFTDETAAANGPTTAAESDGYGVLGVTARMFHAMNDELTLVPMIEWMSDKRGASVDTSAAATVDMALDEQKTSTLSAALGANIFPSEKTMLVTAFGLDMVSTETTRRGAKTGEGSTNIFPYIKGGIEAEVKSWCDFRAGVEKQLISTSNEPVNGTQSKGKNSSFQGFVGAGFYIASLVVDVQVSTAFLHRGPFFISGAAANLNNRVTLSYPF